MKKKKIWRFVIEIDEETHTTVKMRCHLKNMSMRIYVLQAITEKILKEDYNLVRDNLYEH